MLILRGFVLFLAGWLVSACSSAPPIKYYVLEPIPLPALPALEAQHLTVGVGPVSIPALLDRKKMVTRLPDKSVQIDEFHHWAAPLQDNIAETVAKDLAAMMPEGMVRIYPWSVHGTVDLQVVIDVTRFDTTLGQATNLEANWTIKEENGHKILRTGKTSLANVPMESSHAASVRGLSLLLGQLSQELALAIRQQ